jgi:hypothetical protein
MSFHPLNHIPFRRVRACLRGGPALSRHSVVFFRQPRANDLRIVAPICARNEELHIARCLRDILSGGIEVILIDHESKVCTVEIARRYLGDGLLSIERLA